MSAALSVLSLVSRVESVSVFSVGAAQKIVSVREGGTLHSARHDASATLHPSGRGASETVPKQTIKNDTFLTDQPSCLPCVTHQIIYDKLQQTIFLQTLCVLPLTKCFIVLHHGAATSIIKTKRKDSNSKLENYGMDNILFLLIIMSKAA